MRIVFTVLGVAVAAIAAADLQQRQHAILRNFPIIGHFRYLLEKVGPELRQYIVTSNTEEKPFNRHERRWVYASAKRQNNYFGFGTDQDIEHSPNYLIVKHSAFPISSPRPTDPACPNRRRHQILGGSFRATDNFDHHVNIRRIS